MRNIFNWGKLLIEGQELYWGRQRAWGILCMSLTGSEVRLGWGRLYIDICIVTSAKVLRLITTTFRCLNNDQLYNSSDRSSEQHNRLSPRRYKMSWWEWTGKENILRRNYIREKNLLKIENFNTENWKAAW